VLYTWLLLSCFCSSWDALGVVEVFFVFGLGDDCYVCALVF